MRTTVETITPEKAREWLKSNTDNRSVRDAQVQFLTKQITSGHWQITHQGIAFSVKGRLLDGQHRLMAIVAANQTVRMAVTRDMEESTYKVIDCGTARTHYDRLNLVNDKAMNRRICVLISTYLRVAVRGQNGGTSVSDIEDEFLRRCESWQWAAGTFPTQGLDGMGRASVVAAIAIYHSCAPKKADQFAVGFRSGEDLSHGSPILSLRRSLANLASHVPANYWKTVSAIKAHSEGREIAMVMEAIEDIVGNKNSFRLVKNRKEAAVKGNKTRRALV